jgi:hypothetical protein
MGYKDIVYVGILLVSLTGLHVWHESDKEETRVYRDEMDRLWMEYIEKLENQNYRLINGKEPHERTRTLQPVSGAPLDGPDRRSG